MNKIITLIFVCTLNCLIISNSYAKDVPVDPLIVEDYIKKLDLNIDQDKAKELAKHYSTVAFQFNLDPKIIVAIAYQENSFRMSGISDNDIGHMQLNYYWQIVKKKRATKISIEELDNNWRLNVYLAAEHLDDVRKSCPDKKEWWVCYHSFTPKYQKIYKSRIHQHLGRIDTDVSPAE